MERKQGPWGRAGVAATLATRRRVVTGYRRAADYGRLDALARHAIRGAGNDGPSAPLQRPVS